VTGAVLALAACGGWGLAIVLALCLRRRLSLVADAEHELRGAAAAVGLAVDRVSRQGATMGLSSLIRLQLDRMAAGLEDLAAARAPSRVRRAAAPGDADVDAGRLAQVLGNLIANAAEHGIGSVDVQASRPAGAVRIEIRNRNRPRELADASAARPEGRGRGLSIAERAARELGGRLSVESRGGETRAELELPAPGRGGAEPAEVVLGAEPADAVLGAEPADATLGAEPADAMRGAEPADAAIGAEPAARDARASRAA
jgi:hypothetical protein